MTFRLRTLLVLVTVCGLAVAWSLQIANQKEKRRLHRTAFEELDDQVAAMDNELASWIALVLKKNRRVQIEHVTDRD